MLSQYAEPSYALRCSSRARTAAATCSRSGSTTLASCAAAIEAVAQGGAVIDPKLVDALVMGKAAARALAARRPDAARARGARRDRAGKSNSAIADSLVLTKRAVEKHINSIFFKLGLADADDVSKRVKAALLFLSDTHLLHR